jgi:hypothetical protein
MLIQARYVVCVPEEGREECGLVAMMELYENGGRILLLLLLLREMQEGDSS